MSKYEIPEQAIEIYYNRDKILYIGLVVKIYQVYNIHEDDKNDDMVAQLVGEYLEKQNTPVKRRRPVNRRRW